MRRTAALVLSLAFLSSVAVAGDGCPMSGGTCPNGCPLAQDANSHRSSGEEAIVASKLIRAEYVKTISKAIADL